MLLMLPHEATREIRSSTVSFKPRKSRSPSHPGPRCLTPAEESCFCSIYHERTMRDVTDKPPPKQEHFSEVLRCPSCQNQLVLKRGPYRQFYACKGFPLCKYRIATDSALLAASRQKADEKIGDPFRAINPGSKLQVTSKRTKVRGAWTTVTRFDYV